MLHNAKTPSVAKAAAQPKSSDAVKGADRKTDPSRAAKVDSTVDAIEQVSNSYEGETRVFAQSLLKMHNVTKYGFVAQKES